MQARKYSNTSNGLTRESINKFDIFMTKPAKGSTSVSSLVMILEVMNDSTVSVIYVAGPGTRAKDKPFLYCMQDLVPIGSV